MGTQGTQDQGKCEHPLLSVPLALLLLLLSPSKAVTWDLYMIMVGAVFLRVFPGLCEPLDVTPLPGNCSLR